MRAFVRLGALVVTGIALVQWWQLADRASHIARMYWKFGDFPVTTSVLGLSLFLACSLVGTAIGLVVAVLARRERAWPYLLARVSVSALVLGTLAWPAAVVSPLVRIMEP